MKYETIKIIDGYRLRRIKLINEGTEGKIYAINRRWVVKVYHEVDINRMKKIEALMTKINTLKLKDRRYIKKHVAVPVNIITDRRGRQIGFKMRRINKQFKTYNDVFCDSALSYKKRLSFACRFAKLIAILHNNQIYVGDFNPKNFLVDRKARLKMVDVDTIDFRLFGTHYKCFAFYPESISNEAYRKISTDFEKYKTDAKMIIFDEVSDDYSFAYMLFKLLACGSPYACVPANIPERQRQLRGICPIYKEHILYKVPNYIVNKKYLGRKLNQLFELTFVKNFHVKAWEYYYALKRRKNSLLYRFRRVKTYGRKKVR